MKLAITQIIMFANEMKSACLYSIHVATTVI